MRTQLRRCSPYSYGDLHCTAPLFIYCNTQKNNICRSLSQGIFSYAVKQKWEWRFLRESCYSVWKLFVPETDWNTMSIWNKWDAESKGVYCKNPTKKCQVPSLLSLFDHVGKNYKFSNGWVFGQWSCFIIALYYCLCKKMKQKINIQKKKLMKNAKVPTLSLFDQIGKNYKISNRWLWKAIMLYYCPLLLFV